MRAPFLFAVPAVLFAAAAGQEWVAEHGGTAEVDKAGKVVAVSFESSWIADSDLQQLASFSDLRRLNLAHTRLTDPGFRELKSLPNVTELNLYFAEQIGDGAMAVVRNWKNLKRLNLRGTKVTDAGVALLAEHPSLEAIDVGYSLFTDNGFEFLTSIPNLKEVAAGGNKLTDVGLNTLRQIPGLRVLDLSGAQRTDSGLWAATVTDRGLETIALFKNLEKLFLRAAKITDAGSHQLSALQNLKVLELADTQLSASGLGFVSQLKSLEELSLARSPRVDDKAIEALASAPALKWVDLEGTKVTEDGVRKLRERRPQLKVEWKPVS